MAGAHSFIDGKFKCRHRKTKKRGKIGKIFFTGMKWRRKKQKKGEGFDDPLNDENCEGNDLLLKAIRSAPFLFRAVYEPLIGNHRVEIYLLCCPVFNLAHLSLTARILRYAHVEIDKGY